jgi:hypothetical protein
MTPQSEFLFHQSASMWWGLEQRCPIAIVFTMSIYPTTGRYDNFLSQIRATQPLK